MGEHAIVKFLQSSATGCNLSADTLSCLLYFLQHTATGCSNSKEQNHDGYQYDDAVRTLS
jgi:hypothetical protein